LTRNVIDDDWAFTELVEIEPADDEDIEALLAVAMFRVTVTASRASLLLTSAVLTPTPGAAPVPPPASSSDPKCLSRTRSCGL
jgi:hypothetical protein